MTNYDIHLYLTREGWWTARATYTGPDGTQQTIHEESHHCIAFCLKMLALEIEANRELAANQRSHLHDPRLTARYETASPHLAATLCSWSLPATEGIRP